MNKKKDLDIVGELDTTGLKCPDALVEIERFGETIKIGQCFKVTTTDDKESVEEFKQWAKDSNIEIIDSIKKGNMINFTFKK